MIGKVIRIGLAALLAFFVCAPVIVGVYDAANTRTNRASEAALGSIVEQSGYAGGSRHTHDGESAGLAGSEGRIESNDRPEGSEEKQGSYTVTDWYSGDPAACDLLGSGNANLVYKFSDDSVVNFGNPYILEWTDVPKPDDYDTVIADDEASEYSIFSPERAYAGPVSGIVAKLKMLAVKSGYWKSFNSMLYSFAISVAMSSGMTYTAATQCVNKVVAELPAITRVITSETAAFTTEDTAMLVSNSIARVASRKVAVSEFPTALNAEIAANVTAVETTGMLAGGASGNFINTMYQLAATGGVPASILFSDIGLYIGSWLGGNFDDYFDDLQIGTPELSSGTLTFGDHNYFFKFANAAEMLGGLDVNGDISGYIPVYRDWKIQYPNTFYYLRCVPDDANVTYDLRLSSGGSGYIFSSISIDNGTFKVLNTLTNNESVWFVQNDSISVYDNGFYGHEYGDYQQILLSSDVVWNIYDEDKTTLIAQLDHGSYSGELPWTGVSSGESQSFDGQIIGAGAQYDDAGNITDYGNVTVPNIYAPNYVAPGSYADALNQMNATATTDNPAHVDSPSFGQPDVPVKDWVDQNQTPEPETPTESSQNDFKIEDLETVFPYCIPWDLYYLLAQFAADPLAPSFTWHFDFLAAGEYDFTVDLAQYEFVAQVCRACETVAFCIGLALLTRNLIRG